MAAHTATVGFLLVAILQLLLALGVVPITMAWGGTQSVLTSPVRFASLGAAAVMGLFAYIVRRRAGLAGSSHRSSLLKSLAWIIVILLALNTIGNFASPSAGEALLFGPLSLTLALACLVVAASSGSPNLPAVTSATQRERPNRTSGNRAHARLVRLG